MKYKKIVEGKFLKRINRFVAHVEINGEFHVVHVKNTGRCKELLVPGCTCFLSVSDNPTRKTKHDLIGVIKETTSGPLMINMDSYAPNRAMGEWLSKGGLGPHITEIKPEIKFGNSRFDFFFKNNGKDSFLEVKGVTLEKDGVVKFPDAPTERGVKHIHELIAAAESGLDAYICFVVQMSGMKYFTPNSETHKAFADALKEAHSKGVQILAVQCDVFEDGLEINGSLLPIQL